MQHIKVFCVSVVVNLVRKNFYLFIGFSHTLDSEVVLFVASAWYACKPQTTFSK